MRSSALFDVLVGLHIAAALLGFGSVALTGVYGFGGRHFGDDERREEAARYFAAPARLEWLILAVPFLGAAALAVEPRGAGVGQLWAGLAGIVWLVAAGTLLGVIRPGERAVRAAIAAGDDRTATQAASRLGWAGVVTDVAFGVALGLMIWQPH